jgi:hypothetical protein
MLDRFPTEILLHVLSFLSSPGLVRLPPQRHSTLLSLCLVSRGLSRVAQAFLWEAVELEKQAQLETICRRRELREDIHVLVLRDNWWEERALQLIGRWSRVTDVRVIGNVYNGEWDKELLWSFANLPSEPPASSS